MTPFRFCGVDLPSPFFLAPMAGVTNRPFRTVALELGAGLAFTEMVSAAGLVRSDRKTRSLLPAPEEAPRVGVQLFGSRPEPLRDATLIVNELGAPFVDLNFGCPAKKVLRAGCGGALLRDPGRMRAIVEAVCAVSTRPVLVKIRTGWDRGESTAVATARLARDAGAAAVTLHGRFVSQGFGGRADWGAIREVAEDGALPVVGNGDVHTAAGAVSALKGFGCAAVMIGRGACGNPWIFREAAAILGDALHRAAPAGTEPAGAAPPAPAPGELLRVMLRHYDLAIAELGRRTGVHTMRRHLFWYARGRRGAAEFRRRVGTLEDPAVVRAEVERFVAGQTGDAPLPA